MNLLNSVISIVSAYIKEEIRFNAARRKRLNPISQDLDELDARIYELEKQKKDEANKSSDALGWSTINDAVTRGQNAPECGWVLPGIIREGAICNIQSAEKTGKSTLVTQISLDYANGIQSKVVPWKDEEYPSCTQRVFYYDAEMSDDDISERYKGLGDKGILRCPKVFENPEDFLRHLKSSVCNVQANTLVVVDNVSTICPGFYEKDVKQLKQEIDTLQKNFIGYGFRLTFIFIHHTKKESEGKKSKDRAGSARWGELATINLAFSEYGEGRRMLLLISKRNMKSALNPGDGVILDFQRSPYPHFEYKEVVTSVAESPITTEASQSAVQMKKPGPKSKQPKLTDEQLSLMKEMVKAIKSRKPMTIDGVEYKTKKSIAEYFGLKYDNYVGRKLKNYSNSQTSD